MSATKSPEGKAAVFQFILGRRLPVTLGTSPSLALMGGSAAASMTGHPVMAGYLNMIAAMGVAIYSIWLVRQPNITVVTPAGASMADAVGYIAHCAETAHVPKENQ